MKGTVVSVDLDWLNGSDDPASKIRGLLKHIPRKTPTIMTVEHHEFLGQLRRWVRNGTVPVPFNLVNIDEHHDYYVNCAPYDPDGAEVNCGVWGYRIPPEWYRRYTWVHHGHGEFCDWPEAETWLSDRGIVHSVRGKHRLSELKTPITAAVFCVSPDYLDQEMCDQIDRIVEIVVRHFKLPKAPLRLPDYDPCLLCGWRMAPRPMKVSK